MPKLIKRVVDAATPGDKIRFLWDSELAGFGLYVLPSGKKSYVIQYRAGGRSRRVTIGRHGALTPDDARRLAKQKLGRVAAGEDPAAADKAERQAETVSDLCDRFLSEHVAHRCKPITVREYRRSVDLHIRPVIGKLKVKDVARADIAKLQHRWRETPYQANRALAVLSKMFNLAEVWGLRPDGSNPCRHIKKFAEQKRERFLSAEELKRLGKVLDAVERDRSEAPEAVAAFRLLILTGCRLGEIQTLKWSYLRGNVAELPDSKTGAKRVYLGQAALDVLSRLPRRPDNDFVITGKLPGQYLTDLQKPWQRIREKAKLEGVRIHDLRHSFASAALADGEALPVIGKLLGHSQVETTARYAHLADQYVQTSAEKVSGRIAGMLSGSGAGQ